MIKKEIKNKDYNIEDILKTDIDFPSEKDNRRQKWKKHKK